MGRKGKTSMKDRVKKRAQERESSGSSFGYLKVPEGREFFKPSKRMLIDIMPYVVSDPRHPEGVDVGDEWYQRTIFVHHNVGPEKESVICPKTVGKRCPICEYRAQLLKAGGADQELLKELKAQEKELFNVIDLNDTEKGLQIWEYSHYNFGKKLEEELRETDDYGGFAMLDEGFSLAVRMSEETFGTVKYLEASRIDFEERESQYDEEMLEEAVDLDKCFTVLPYEQLQAKFMELPDADKVGEVDDGSDEEEPEEKPKRKPAAKKEEKPAPAKKKAAAKKAAPKKKEPEPEPEPEEPEIEVGSIISYYDEDEGATVVATVTEIDGDELTIENEDYEGPWIIDTTEVEVSLQAEEESEAEEQEEPAAEEEPEEKPKRKPAAKKEAAAADGECPHGGTFGTDCDELKDCQKCKVWEDCYDAWEAAKKK